MVIEGFAELFQGRLNAYGTNEGGCDKIDQEAVESWGFDLESEYLDRIAAHLEGSNPMGVYPLTDDLMVRWGCTDLDYVEDPTDALNMATMLTTAGVNGWVEVSRSKGFHVWTFATEPIPANTMRNALLAVHQLLEIPATEVNPKQTSLEGLKGYGNYVRLPYPGAASTGWTSNERQMVFITGHHPDKLPLADFVDVALEFRSEPAAYERLASAYIAPPPPTQVRIDAEPAISGAIIASMSRGTYLAFRYGPREGHDRSSSLMRLAYLCKEDGLTPAETLAALRDADLRWGKFYDRADGEDQLIRMVTNAHQ